MSEMPGNLIELNAVIYVLSKIKRVIRECIFQDFTKDT